MSYGTQNHKPIRISKGKYTYRGYAIENLGPTTGYYGGTAFRPNDGSWLEIFGHLKH